MYSKLHLSRQVVYRLALLALASVAGCPVNQDTAPPHAEAGQDQARDQAGPPVTPLGADDDLEPSPTPPTPSGSGPDGADPKHGGAPHGADLDPEPNPDAEPAPDPDPYPETGEITLLWAGISSGATVTDAAVMVVGEFAVGVAYGDGIVLQHGIVPCITAP